MVVFGSLLIMHNLKFRHHVLIYLASRGSLPASILAFWGLKRLQMHHFFVNILRF